MLGGSNYGPHVSIGNNIEGLVYAEDSTEKNNQLLKEYSGMDVFIKKNLSIPSKYSMYSINVQ